MLPEIRADTMQHATFFCWMGQYILHFFSVYFPVAVRERYSQTDFSMSAKITGHQTYILTSPFIQEMWGGPRATVGSSPLSLVVKLLHMFPRARDLKAVGRVWLKVRVACSHPFLLNVLRTFAIVLSLCIYSLILSVVTGDSAKLVDRSCVIIGWSGSGRQLQFCVLWCLGTPADTRNLGGTRTTS